ncbi:hypothetical protein C4N16_06825 [Fusobacterium gonidiaformans ATCC 25563]|nr:hypothetical protein C4N16_06825 [Fusobacterium gonidiaformans ATCC 25563]
MKKFNFFFIIIIIILLISFYPKFDFTFRVIFLLGFTMLMAKNISKVFQRIEIVKCFSKDTS